jgi:hypothetical protein
MRKSRRGSSVAYAIPLIFVSAFFCLDVHELANGVKGHENTHNWPANYQKEALKNLTQWRSSLFKRTILLYKETERQSRQRSEPEGHARFNLLSPIVNCPIGDLQRIGGNGDGE